MEAVAIGVIANVPLPTLRRYVTIYGKNDRHAEVRSLKWKSVATAPDQLTAEMWCELLRNEGVPAMVQPSDAVSFLGVPLTSCRVIVPEDRREEAVAILRERMGNTVDIDPP